MRRMDKLIDGRIEDGKDQRDMKREKREEERKTSVKEIQERWMDWCDTSSGHAQQFIPLYTLPSPSLPLSPSLYPLLETQWMTLYE